MRRVRAVHAHLARENISQVAPDRLGDPAGSLKVEALAPLSLPQGDKEAAVQAIITALETDGCALLPGLIRRETCAQLAAELTSYAPGTEGTGLTTRDRSHAARRHLKFGGDITEFGAKSKAELLLTLFNRDPRWLQLLDPSPLIEAVDAILAEGTPAGGKQKHPHLVNQSGWRNHPGHDATGSVHVDELFLTAEQLPPELLDGRDWSPPILIMTALTYLVDVDEALAPTVVVPGSFRAMRSPKPGEMAWRGQGPRTVLAKAGDVLLFRSDVWHGGGANRSPNRDRLVVETVYGARKVANKFFPYVGFELADTTRQAASARQLRLLGFHPVSNYG